MMRTGQAGAMPGRRWMAAGLAGLRGRRAARIPTVAHRDQVAVPAAAAGLLRDWLPAGVGLTDLGRYRLKGAGWPGGSSSCRQEGWRRPSAAVAGRPEDAE